MVCFFGVRVLFGMSGVGSVCAWVAVVSSGDVEADERSDVCDRCSGEWGRDAICSICDAKWVAVGQELDFAFGDPSGRGDEDDDGGGAE